MASDKPKEAEIDNPDPEQKEEPKEATDYRTDLLKAVFQRLSKESYPKVLQAFFDVLLPGTKADSKEDRMFIHCARIYSRCSFPNLR